MNDRGTPFRIFWIAIALVGQFTLSASGNAQQPQSTQGPYRTEEIRTACKLALTKHKPPEEKGQAYMVYIAEGVCMGAISTTMRFGPQMNDKFRFCPPASSAPEDMIPALLDFIDKNPQVLPYDIRDIANYVGRLQWPCQ